MLTAIAPEVLGETVRKLRKAARMTQVDLAKKAGITSETISRIENGLRTTNTTIAAIATALPELSRMFGGGSVGETQTQDWHLPAPPREEEEVKALAQKVAMLVGALSTVERLHEAREFLMRLLEQEHHEEKRARHALAVGDNTSSKPLNIVRTTNRPRR